MAKVSGLGDNFYYAGYDLSGDIGAVDKISTPLGVLDVTGINKGAHERIGALRDGNLQFSAFFNNSAGQEHAALSTLPRTDQIGTYFRGTTIGNPAACINGKQLNYDPTRSNTGALTEKIEIQANGYGLEWGVMLTPGLRTDTAATTGPAFDQGAAGAHGAQAYLQIVGFTGSSVDVVIQHATTSGGSYSTLVDFGSQSGIGAWRAVASGSTVNEFLKVVTSGTFTSVTFAVAVVTNPVAVAF